METEVKIEDWAAIKELARMSIGTDKGSWWADKSFGSELWILRLEGKVDNHTAGRMQQMILDCLKWLKDDGLAADIFCQTEQTGKNEITYYVKILRPIGEPVMIKETWSAVK